MQNKRQQKERKKRKKIWAIFHPQSDHARHFLNWCDIYRVMTVVHRSWSDNHYKQSNTQLPTLKHTHACHMHTHSHAQTHARTHTCAHTQTHARMPHAPPAPPPLLHLFGFRFLELVKQITASTSHQMPTLFST